MKKIVVLGALLLAISSAAAYFIYQIGIFRNQSALREVAKATVQDSWRTGDDYDFAFETSAQEDGSSVCIPAEGDEVNGDKKGKDEEGRELIACNCYKDSKNCAREHRTNCWHGCRKDLCKCCPGV